MKITRIKLKNGLKILHYYMPHLNSVSMSYFINVGSRDEDTPDKYGIAHFIEHMMFNGSSKYPTSHGATLIGERYGIYQNAWTFNDATNYLALASKANARKAFEILSDRVIDPLFNEVDMVKEKGIISEEIKMGDDSPYRRNWKNINEMIFRGTDLEHETIGTNESVNNFTKEQLFDFKNKYYSPPNMVLAVAGNIEVDEIKAWAEEDFNGISSGTVNKRKDIAKLNIDNREKIEIKDFMTQDLVYLAYPTEGLLSEDKYALSLIANMLGAGKASQFENEIKVKKSLVSSIDAETILYTDIGMFLISFECFDKDLDKVLSMIEAQIEKIRNKGLDKKYFERARNMVTSGYKYMYESSQPHIDFQSMAHFEAVTGIEWDIDEILDRYTTIQFDEVAQIASKLKDPLKAIVKGEK